MVEKKNHPTYDEIAANLLQEIKAEMRLAIIGSQSFHSHISRSICKATGRELAKIDNLVLLTGGVTSIGETVGRSFWEPRKLLGKPAQVYHILPQGSQVWRFLYERSPSYSGKNGLISSGPRRRPRGSTRG